MNEDLPNNPERRAFVIKFVIKFVPTIIASAFGSATYFASNDGTFHEIGKIGKEKLQELFPYLSIDADFSIHNSANVLPTDILAGEIGINILDLLSQNPADYNDTTYLHRSGIEFPSSQQITQQIENYKTASAFVTMDGDISFLNLSAEQIHALDVAELKKNILFNLLGITSTTMVSGVVDSSLENALRKANVTRRFFLKTSGTTVASAVTGLFTGRLFPAYGLLKNLDSIHPNDYEQLKNVETAYDTFTLLRDLNMAMNTQLFSQWDLSILANRLNYFCGKGHINSVRLLSVSPKTITEMYNKLLLGTGQNNGIIDVLTNLYLDAKQPLEKQAIHITSLMLLLSLNQIGIGYFDAEEKHDQIKIFKETYRKRIDGQTAYLTLALALKKHYEKKQNELASNPEKLQEYTVFIDSLIGMTYGRYANKELTIKRNGFIHTRLLDQRPDDETFLLSYLEISHRDGFVTDIRDTRTR